MMENGESRAASDEFEIVQMYRVDAGRWVNLEGIIVCGRVFEQAVEWIEHFV